MKNVNINTYIFLIVLLLFFGCNPFNINKNNKLLDRGSSIADETDIDYIIERIKNIIPKINGKSKIVHSDSSSFDFILIQRQWNSMVDMRNRPKSRQYLFVFKRDCYTTENPINGIYSNPDSLDGNSYNIEIYSFSKHDLPKFIASISSVEFVGKIIYILKSFKTSNKIPLFSKVHYETNIWIKLNDEFFIYTDMDEMYDRNNPKYKTYHFLEIYLLSEILKAKWEFEDRTYIDN